MSCRTERFTKVNRCLTEGRRHFLDRVAGIEAGAECDRLAPLVSALADGEATAEDMGTLRPHLRSCLACRAMLREYRRIPHRAAELVPLGGAEHGDGVAEALGGWLDSAIAWLQERAGLVAAKAQAASEGASVPKIAALAASTAALAGGSVALHEIDAARGADPQPGAASEPLLETANATPPAQAPRAARTPPASVAPKPPVVSTERPALAVPIPQSEPATPAVTAPVPAPPRVGEGAPPPVADPVVAEWRSGGYGGEPPDVPDEALSPTSRSTGAGEEDLDLDPLTTPWRPPPPEEEPPPPEPPAEEGSPTEGSTAPATP